MFGAFECLGIKGCKNLEELKLKIFEDKILHSKYTLRVSKMNEAQLKKFIFFGEYEEKVFEGVARIFTCIAKKDEYQLVKFIMSIDLGAINILRIMIYSLNNADIYKDTNSSFYYNLLLFKSKIGKKFKNLLIPLAMKNKIDRLDLIGVLLELIDELRNKC